MKKFLIGFIWVIVLFYLLDLQQGSVSGTPSEATYKDYNDSLSVYDPGQPIAVVGDLQRTSIWEIMVGREQNDEERNRIISEVKKENPALMILLGDMVSDGSSDDNWKYFDNLMSKVKGIPILPVLGNHDYYVDGNNVKFNSIKNRFSQFDKANWYSRIYGNIALVFIDSNEPKMSNAEWKAQRQWFEQTIIKYDKDPGIKSIIVFMHHPPYTNSIVTGDEQYIQKTFIKTFNNSRKTVAMFSGHAHTYEHFIKEGKSFIVSGGGGAPRVILKKGIDCHKDQYTYKGVRPFHYIILQPNENNIEVIVKGFDKGETKFSVIDKFKIPYSSKSPLSFGNQ